MKARHLFIAMLIFAATMSLTTCTDGIFSIIEAEQKVITSTLPLTISIYDVVVSVPNTTYFVAAGAVYRGTLNGDGTMTWLPDDDSRPLNPPGKPMCIAMAFDGTELWGSFITSGGTLYKSSSLTFEGQSSVSGPAIDGKRTGLLQMANGHLFMCSTLDNSTYELDEGVAPWTVQKSGLTSPVIGIGFDGTRYWMATNDLVYSQNILDHPTFPAAGTATLGPYTVSSGIKGLFVDPVNANRIFVTTKSDGVIYTLDAGTNWHQVEDQVGSNTVGYLCVAGPVNTLSGSDKYLVGSDGYGYYTLNVSTNDFSRFDDSTIGLFSHSVANILVDGQNVLMGTHANGLWRAKFDTTTGDLASGDSWVHE